jgi:hypothetical protein
MERKEKRKMYGVCKAEVGISAGYHCKVPGLINADENSNAIGPPIQTRTSKRRIIVHRM